MKDEPTLDSRTEADQLLDLTQAMLAAAKADDWDLFELLEPQRKTMLEMVFGNQSDETAKLQMVDVVKEIQLIDKAICELIGQQRDQAAEELRQLKHARAGNKAYRSAIDDSF